MTRRAASRKVRIGENLLRYYERTGLLPKHHSAIHDQYIRRAQGLKAARRIGRSGRRSLQSIRKTLESARER